MWKIWMKMWIKSILIYEKAFQILSRPGENNTVTIRPKGQLFTSVQSNFIVSRKYIALLTSILYRISATTVDSKLLNDSKQQKQVNSSISMLNCILYSRAKLHMGILASFGIFFLRYRKGYNSNNKLFLVYLCSYYTVERKYLWVY